MGEGKILDGSVVSKAKKRQAFFDKIMKVHGEIDSIKAKNASACKGKLETIKEILDDCENAGFSRKAMKGLVKEAELSGKIDDIRAKLEDEDQDDFDQGRADLGFDDTPLGKAAAEAEDKPTAKVEPIRDAQGFH